MVDIETVGIENAFAKNHSLCGRLPSICLPHSVENLISGFNKLGRYTYFPVGIEMVDIKMLGIKMVGIKMVGIDNAFVAKRSQCQPSLHLLMTVFGRYTACFSMKTISMPTVIIPT